MRTLYTLVLYLATPFVLLYLFVRGLRSSDYLRRWPERFGRFERPQRTGGITVHAASMGEVNAAGRLIQEIRARFPDEPLCLTTLTPTGSARVSSLFADTAFHVYAPLDLPGAVQRFLSRVKPQLLIIMETEIWPNLYYQAAARDIPIVIVNARISERSIDSYRRLRGLTGATLRKVNRIAAQSTLDRQRLIELGADESRITVTGNMKFDVWIPPSLSEQGEAIRMGWGTHRLVLLGGSTHEADEQQLIEAFKRLLPAFPGALLVLVPRHPERFSRTAQLAQQAGLTVSLRSTGLSCPGDTQCFVVDCMGELQQFYATCDVAFVGGSLEAVGGHNVLEPAALAKPVLFGPHTANFADITQQLLDCGGAVRVADTAELEGAVRRLFTEPELRDRMGRAGQDLVRSGQGAVARTLEIIEAVLTPANR